MAWLLAGAQDTNGLRRGMSLQALVFGDLHGRIRAMYTGAERWSESHGTPVDVILQVGDFGIFPDPSKLDKEKVGKYGPGDYASLMRSDWRAPIPTYFCKGNNEDFEALARPLLPGLTWVPDGEVITLGETRIAFLGGGWAPKSYLSDEGKPNHISRPAVEALMQKEFDILISHEAPAGSRFHAKAYSVGAPPLRELVEAKQPAMVIHGHHHAFAERHMSKTRVIALDLLRAASHPGAVFPILL